jgi:hypothetical protein
MCRAQRTPSLPQITHASSRSQARAQSPLSCLQGQPHPFSAKGSVFSVVVQGAGTVTITCSGCTINGAATLVLTQNQGAEIFGDGTNYVANKGGGGGGGGTNIGGSTALGNQVASDGSGFSSQPKPAIDVRDTVGIDCTGNTDSSTALNAILANISQSELDIPATCQLRADSQIVIQGQTGWKIKGLGDRPGVLGFGGPSIFGCNGSAGASALHQPLWVRNH